MSTSLRFSIERYVEAVLDGQDRITSEEIRFRSGDIRSLPSRVGQIRRGRVGLAVSRAVSLLVLAIAVAAVWLASARNDGARGVLDSTIPETHRIIGGDLEPIEAYVLEMARQGEAPEPLFDLATLGTEVDLFPVERPIAVRSRKPGYSFWEVRPGEVVTVLWSAAVSLERLTAEQLVDPPAALAQVFIEVKSGGGEVELSLAIDVSDFSVPGMAIGMGSGGPIPRSDWLVVVLQDDGNDARNPNIVAIGGLPPSASIVATTLADGSPVWQRPIDGIALFSGVADRGTYRVLDAHGQEILSIQSSSGGAVVTAGS